MERKKSNLFRFVGMYVCSTPDFFLLYFIVLFVRREGKNLSWPLELKMLFFFSQKFHSIFYA